MHLILKSMDSLRRAKKVDLPGSEFDTYGRLLGLRLLAAGVRGGFQYLVNPVSITRYFEFAFAESFVVRPLSRVLDLSSPRLFAFWLAERRSAQNILMTNPDRRDIEATAAIAGSLAIRGIDPIPAAVEDLAVAPGSMDLVYSISVIEHIPGGEDDTHAVERLWRTVRPGGSLILTVPVDRRFWVEYRREDPYSLQATDTSGAPVFFQRWYDKEALERRILAPLKDGDVSVRFFGERRPGTFSAYVEEWMKQGLRATVRDPEIIASHFRSFTDWERMPGSGVVGIHARKAGA